MINAIGGLGGFFGPSIVGVLKETTGFYGPGMAALALGPLSGAAIVLTLGRSMQARQDRLDAARAASPPLRG